jgi:hypothetical protein
MEEQLIYVANGRYLDEDKVKKINEHIAYLMSKLGGKVINISYILSDGVATEAYGYYDFPKLGRVAVSLARSNRLGYNFCATLLGFEKKKEKYNKIKRNLMEVLKRVGLYRIDIK